MTVSSILKGGIEIGLKNFISLVGALILYVLTIWIPYLNVGTTIAMVSIPAALSRGQMISPTEIFDAKYRKKHGEFLPSHVFYDWWNYNGIFILRNSRNRPVILLVFSPSSTCR